MVPVHIFKNSLEEEDFFTYCPDFRIMDLMDELSSTGLTIL